MGLDKETEALYREKVQAGLEPATPSVRNMVDSLRLERSGLSLFLPAHAPPASATGSGGA